MTVKKLDQTLCAIIYKSLENSATVKHLLSLQLTDEFMEFLRDMRNYMKRDNGALVYHSIRLAYIAEKVGQQTDHHKVYTQLRSLWAMMVERKKHGLEIATMYTNFMKNHMGSTSGIPALFYLYLKDAVNPPPHSYAQVFGGTEHPSAFARKHCLPKGRLSAPTTFWAKTFVEHLNKHKARRTPLPAQPAIALAATQYAIAQCSVIPTTPTSHPECDEDEEQEEVVGQRGSDQCSVMEASVSVKTEHSPELKPSLSDLASLFNSCATEHACRLEMDTTSPEKPNAFDVSPPSSMPAHEPIDLLDDPQGCFFNQALPPALDHFGIPPPAYYNQALEYLAYVGGSDADEGFPFIVKDCEM